MKQINIVYHLLRVLFLQSLMFYVVLTGADDKYEVPLNCRDSYCVDYTYEYQNGDIKYPLLPFRSYGLYCGNYSIKEKKMICNKAGCMYATPLFENGEKLAESCRIVELVLPKEETDVGTKLVFGKYYWVEKDGIYYNSEEFQGTKSESDFSDGSTTAFCHPKTVEATGAGEQDADAVVETTGAGEQTDNYSEPCILKIEKSEDERSRLNSGKRHRFTSRYN